QAMANDAFTMAAPRARLRPLLAPPQTKLTSHFAHDEADALPLLGQIMSPAELGAITMALRGGGPAHTFTWPLAHSTPAAATPAARPPPQHTPPLVKNPRCDGRRAAHFRPTAVGAGPFQACSAWTARAKARVGAISVGE